MAAPTREDAQLMIQIMQWSTVAGMKDAVAAIAADDFDPETADALDDAVSTVLITGESVGALVKHDLLSRELVDDFFWIDGMWARVGPSALKLRERMGEPRLYENFEALAQSSE